MHDANGYYYFILLLQNLFRKLNLKEENIKHNYTLRCIFMYIYMYIFMFSYFTRNFITFHVDTFEFILVNYIKKLKKIKYY